MRNLRIAIVLGAIVLAVGLFVVLRPGDDDEASEPATVAATTAAETGETTTEVAPTTETTTTTEQAPPPAAPGPVRARVTVRGGEVVGGRRRFKVKQGRPVVLVVRADVEDEVHLHGYDLTQNVRPGAPARLRFKASIAGRFEVELEDRKLPIAELEVRP